MVQCEMCGKSGENLISGIIEGVELKVCNECLKLGERKKEKKVLYSKQTRKFSGSTDEFEERVIVSAGKLIKEYREKKGMRQQDLAKMLQIKDSQLHHIEIGDMPLRLSVAKRIQNSIGVTLVKKFKDIKVEKTEKASSGLTLGDMIKLKIKK